MSHPRYGDLYNAATAGGGYSQEHLPRPSYPRQNGQTDSQYSDVVDSYYGSQQHPQQLYDEPQPMAHHAAPANPAQQQHPYSNNGAQYQQSQASLAPSYYDHQGADPQWDLHSTKSGKSYASQSQQHLVPHHEYHEMAQREQTQPAMPALQYGQMQPEYPPNANPNAYVDRNIQFAPGMRPDPRHQNSSGGWSAARERLMKRRSVRRVELQQGNLVLDMPVPQSIVPPGRKSEEFTHIRYTACTVDPDEFMQSKYSLRPFLYGRKTELFCVLTMYNEDEELFCKTMNAVIKNIQHLCGRNKSKTWGPDGWEKIVVCVVSDGRSKINQRTLKVLSLMGVYQDGVAKDTVNGKDVQAHIFEYTSSVIVAPNGEVSQSSVPVQVLFCLKEQNKKKLNSHRWFFNAFCPLIQPNVCILLDVGTKPTGTSLYELWKCFDKHKHVGGACGEIAVDAGRGCSILLKSPLAASQNFEYKMSNILDKSLESVCGYISVLPGAFSAYRYKALLNLPNGTGPLASYFKGEAMHGQGLANADLATRNMYLAEDRILCFEIVTKKTESWTLKYIKSAKAVTDVPTTLPEFISQRRRWLNGSFFAAFHATLYMFRIWTSGHNFFRKIILQLEFLYNAFSMLMSFLALGNFYLAFFFLVQSATKTGPNDAFNFLANGAGAKVFEVVLKLYVAVIFVTLICSLGNRPQGSKWTYWAAVILFGVCQIITLWCAGFTVYLAVPHSDAGWHDVGKLFGNKTFRDIAISLGATFGLYIVGSLLHLEPWHLFTSMVQYMFFLPSYVNILMMYSMCNLHDLAWGTKGDNGSGKDLGGAKKVKGDNGKEMMEVEVVTEREDVERLWSESRNVLRVPPPKEKSHRDAATKQSDHDRSSRTNTVLLWIGVNMILIIVFTSDFFLKWASDHFDNAGGVFNPYLSFLFYVVAGMSAVRFVGCLLFVIFNMFGL